MNNLIKYAAATQAMKLMSRGGGQGRGFFRDLMKRQQGLKDFRVPDEQRLLRQLGSKHSGETMSNLPDPGGDRASAVRTLKRLLRQGESSAKPDLNVDINPDRMRTPPNSSPPRESAIQRLLQRRIRQDGAAGDHASALRRQQGEGRANAAQLDDLLGKIEPFPTGH